MTSFCRILGTLSGAATLSGFRPDRAGWLQDEPDRDARLEARVTMQRVFDFLRLLAANLDEQLIWKAGNQEGMVASPYLERRASSRACMIVAYFTIMLGSSQTGNLPAARYWR